MKRVITLAAIESIRARRTGQNIGIDVTRQFIIARMTSDILDTGQAGHIGAVRGLAGAQISNPIDDHRICFKGQHEGVDAAITAERIRTAKAVKGIRAVTATQYVGSGMTFQAVISETTI